MSDNPFTLAGQRVLITGIANENSIAYGVAKVCKALGATVVATYQNEKTFKFVAPLFAALDVADSFKFDVLNQGDVDGLEDYAKRHPFDHVLHSLAGAEPQHVHALRADVVDASREEFNSFMSVSAHSFAALVKATMVTMLPGGSFTAVTYDGSSRVRPGYRLMSACKAALEALVRQFAHELGEFQIRVNAVSPGPIKTRAASGIGGFDAMLETAEKVNPLRRTVTQDEIAMRTVAIMLNTGVTGVVDVVDCGQHVY